MPMLRNVTNGYLHFFGGCLDFALLPYTKTFFTLADFNGSPKDTQIPRAIFAATVTGILTFVIPILPAIFSLTSSIAMIAASLAVASMFILYPLALLNDLCEASDDTSLYGSSGMAM